MKYDQSHRPYVASPLMAQYFAGHLQTHYKRVVMGYIGIIAMIVVLIGGTVRGCSASAPSIGNAETNSRIWSFLEALPFIGGLESDLHGPHYDNPSIYPANPPGIPFPTDPVAPATTDAPGTGSDFYTCTPGTKWCD